MGTMDKAVRIFFIGVGGQGTLLATRMVGEAALEEGLSVLMSEIHGMAQRGGVVESSVVIGKGVSPTIADGEADIIIAFEPLEAARALAKCSPASVVISNITPVLPFSVTAGQATYPDREALFHMVDPHVRKLLAVDADGLARSVEAERSSNVVMIGVLAGTGLLPISRTSWEQALRNTLPERLIEANLRAFQSGFSFGEKSAVATAD